MEADDWLVDRYQLRRPIGAGGIGQVWTAHDTVLGREVAIKVQQADPDEDHAAFDRFVREARSAAALQHPNVVTIFDSGTDGDTAFLVMELLPGPTLTGYLAQRGPLPEPEAVALAAQVASGLAAAHGAGIVHRDIKPANLMFDARGTLKIVDFGIARLTQTISTRLTARNAVIGSPPYLSPEQLHGQPADERSDIYCLGGVLMTMLTGRAPFGGTHPLALLQQHRDAAPPQVSDRRPGVAPGLDALVTQMLSESPQDRPQSVVEVLDRLTGAVPQAPTQAAMPETRVAVGPNQRATPAAAYGGAAVAPRPRSLLGLGILAGAAAMALVAILVAALVPTAVSPAAGRSAPVPSASTAIGADPSSSSPSLSTPGPTTDAPSAAKTTAAKTAATQPTAAEATTATVRRATPTRRAPSAAASSRRATTAPEGSRTSDTSSDGTALDQALSSLRGTVGEVANSGQVDPAKADELTRRVDGLSQQLEKKSGADATRKVDDLDRYLAGLATKDRLTPAGQQRISTALAGVRNVLTSG